MQIYLDNSATTRVRKEVISEMNKAMDEDYGNPSSIHGKGDRARELIDKAREKIAKEIGAHIGSIIFTSGGTESNNLAILGLAKAIPSKKTIVISRIEHPSVAEPCEYLESQGYKIIRIGVDNDGIFDYRQLESVLRDNRDTLVVSLMHVNNIIGSTNDIEKIGSLCAKYGAPFHTDAVQSFGKLNIDVKKANISLLSASGHKINGPKGVGFLYIREGINLEPIVYGGWQERGLRSGTENVPGIVGMAKALELIKKVNKNKIEKQRGKLIKELELIGGILNGSKKERIYNNINIRFNFSADQLVSYLSEKGIYVSSRSACDSKKEKEDSTLKAIGLSKKEINGSIRLVLDETIGDKEIKMAVNAIKSGIKIFGQ